MYLTDYPKVKLFIVEGWLYEDPAKCTNPQYESLIGVFDTEELARDAASLWLMNNGSGETRQSFRTLNEPVI